MSSSLDAPTMRQSVRWGERYVSSGLNRKLAGILPAGVYRGYKLKPGVGLSVLVAHDTLYPSSSIAVVERDGFSLTVTMDDAGYVEIPAAGTWYIVIEAYYVETQPGYQRIVAREEVSQHHVVLGKVTIPAGSSEVTESMLADTGRQECSVVTSEDLKQISSIVESLRHAKEAVWTTTEAVAEGGYLQFPDSMTYADGENLIDLFFNGVCCYQDLQYEEVPANDGTSESSKIKMLFAVPAGSEMRLFIRAHSSSDALDGTTTSELATRIAALTEKLAKVEEGAAYCVPPIEQ